ncbi:MAG: hypothetical protein J6X37_03130 [Treponema sp.]|uniref:hypothetical protein n=1 Tax=Treponema sp. TaxID=166 RepID=UPI001B54623E|nr:hypothetical protein [Treponema sp.]
MKLTEVLVTVLISLLLVTGITYAYSACVKNYSQIIEKEKDNRVVLYVDREMRKEISSFCVPYWKNSDEKRFVLEERVRKIAEENNCEVKRVEVLKKKSREAGLEVEWTYLDKKIITKEVFASRVWF